MWAHTVKCLTSCQGFSATTRCSTCQITLDSVPVLSPCQIPQFPCTHPSSNPSRRARKSHADLLRRRETFSSRVLNKATLAGIMLNYPAKKNPINPGAAVGKPHSADGVGAAHKSSSLAELRARTTLLLLFIYFSGHILFSFNLFINAGIMEVSTEFGGGLPKDYIAVSKPDTCLWLPEKQQCETRIELTTFRSHLPLRLPSLSLRDLSREMPRQPFISLICKSS